MDDRTPEVEAKTEGRTRAKSAKQVSTSVPANEMPPAEPLPPSMDKPPQPRSGGAPGISFALILIAIGAVFLLGNLGLISLSFTQLARFWPLLLIILGLDIMFGRRSVAGSALVGLVTVVAIVGVVWFSQTPGAQAGPSAGDVTTGALHVPLKDAKSIKVVIDLSDLPLELDSQTDGSMVHGQFKASTASQPTIDYKMDGDVGIVTVKQPKVQGIPFNFADEHYLKLHLPEGVPIDLEVHTDLGQTVVDLTNLTITNVDVEAGSGQLQVTLPQSSVMEGFAVKADLGQLLVIAPDGAELTTGSFTVTSGSGQLQVTLPQSGNLGDVDIEGDLGQVSVVAQEGGHIDAGSVTIKSGSGQLSVELPPHASLGDVDIEGDLGQVSVDFPGGPQSVSVKSLHVKAGSGAMSVVLPNVGQYDANLESDLGSVDVEIPQDLEASVHVDQGLGKVNVNNDRLSSSGDSAWQTSDPGADNSVNLSINGGSGAVTIR